MRPGCFPPPCSRPTRQPRRARPPPATATSGTASRARPGSSLPARSCTARCCGNSTRRTISSRSGRRGRRRRQALVNAVLRAGEQGLDPDLFHGALLRNAAALPPIDRELLLSDAVLAYADALARGAVPIETRLDDEDLTPEPIDVVAALDNAIDSPDPAKAIEALAPHSPAYVALQQALRDYRAAAAAGETAQLGAEAPEARRKRPGSAEATGEARLRADRGEPRALALAAAQPPGRSRLGQYRERPARAVPRRPAGLHDPRRHRRGRQADPGISDDDRQPVVQSAVERAAFDREHGDPAKAGRGPGLSEPPSHGDARQRLDRAASGSGNRAGPAQIRDAGPVRCLPSRHPAEGSVRPRQPPPEPRLRAGAEPARAGRAAAAATGRRDQPGDRAGLHQSPHAADADPGVHGLPDRVPRCRRRRSSFARTCTSATTRSGSACARRGKHRWRKTTRRANVEAENPDDLFTRRKRNCGKRGRPGSCVATTDLFELRAGAMASPGIVGGIGHCEHLLC